MAGSSEEEIVSSIYVGSICPCKDGQVLLLQSEKKNKDDICFYLINEEDMSLKLYHVLDIS